MLALTGYPTKIIIDDDYNRHCDNVKPTIDNWAIPISDNLPLFVKAITNDEWIYNYKIFIIYFSAMLTGRNLTEFLLEVLPELLSH